MGIERRVLGDLGVGFERGGDHPVDRQQDDAQDQHEDRGAGEGEAPVGCHSGGPARFSIRTAKSAKARMIRPTVTKSAAA